MGSMPRSGRPPGGELDNPLSILAWTIPMDRGAWRATVHGVAKSWARRKQHNPHAHVGLINGPKEITNAGSFHTF